LRLGTSGWKLKKEGVVVNVIEIFYVHSWK
jgi:hypothetical protein